MRVDFDYTRSLGPVLSVFMTGLRDGRILAARTSAGLVVPPPEFDPVTLQPPTQFEPVADTGVVETWTWVPDPVADQPFERPFAFALIRLDGVESTLLHAVDVPAADDMRTGMRVRARWREHRVGAITDIACFVPEESPASTPDTDPSVPTAGAGEPVTGIVTPVRLRYTYAASPEESAFFRGLADGRILGQRCPACGKVYVPPRGACPVDGVPTTDEVELSDEGTVTTFCIVNVPFLGQRITPPYVSAYVLLDGADIAFLHLLLDVDPAEVRMGMRVRAVWRPRQEWTTSLENISHFAPTGAPDADYDTYKGHL